MPVRIHFTDDGRLALVPSWTEAGQLIIIDAATYKGARSVGFWDLESGEEVGRVDTLRPIPHGIVISPDGKYAFATIEGVGGEPGSVEAYDLSTFERVANLDVAKQAGGIAFWKMQ